jgi:hypothetical protein
VKLIQAGRTLVYRISDFDSNDKYTFVLMISEYSKNPVDLFWNLYGSRDSGQLAVSPEALEGATRLARFSQGHVQDGDQSLEDDRLMRSTPPFLLSRAVFRSLKEKHEAMIDFPVEGGSLALTSESSTFVLPHSKISVNAIEAKGRELELTILDDAQWPVILKASFEDDNEISLVGLTFDDDAE